jgi:hypothetical protein
MIPVAISTAISNLIAAVTAAGVLNEASPLELAAIEMQAVTLVSDIDDAVTDAAGQLDADDPTGYVGDFPGDLEALRDASVTQAQLCGKRGLVGRALFNLQQANP